MMKTVKEELQSTQKTSLYPCSSVLPNPRNIENGNPIPLLEDDPMKKALSMLLFLLLLFTAAFAENVSRLPYDLAVRGITISGLYSGETTNGIPDGYGLFETQTPDGTPCHYIGEWKDGIMQGSGSMYWNDGSLEIGEYSNGIFVTGKYNYNGLTLLTAKADGDETLNPYWLNKLTRASMQEDDPATVKYIGNKSSRVFHRLDCNSVRTMKEKNKLELYSREEAIEKGYKPCSSCLP